MQKLWAGIVSLFVLLLGGFLFERSKRKDDEVLLDNSKMNESNASSAQHIKDLEKDNSQEKAHLDEAKKEDISGKDLANFLDKNLK